MTKRIVKKYCLNVLDVEVISEASAAVTALGPMRSRLLAELDEPASAAALASRLDLPRQKVNYHLRALESAGLVGVAEVRRWGGLSERLMVSSARTYVVSPEALGPVAADPSRSGDRLAASYLIALGARVIREVGALWSGARRSGKSLATLAIDTEVRFANPAARAAFTQDLTRAVTELVSRYHDTSAVGGREHRLVIVAHPTPEPGKDA